MVTLNRETEKEMSKDFTYWTQDCHEELVEMALDFSEDSSNRAHVGGDGIIWDCVGADIYLAMGKRNIRIDPVALDDALKEAAAIMNGGI